MQPCAVRLFCRIAMHAGVSLLRLYGETSHWGRGEVVIDLEQESAELLDAYEQKNRSRCECDQT